MARAVDNAVGPAATSQGSGVTDLDWRRIAKHGLLAGLAMVFVAAIGMMETFDRRLVVAPILSLGYVSIGWIPLVMGHLAAKEKTLEGMPAPEKGARNVVSGMVAGLVAGGVLWLFVVIVDSRDLTGVFVKLSSGLVDLLTFDGGLGVGLLTVVIGSGILGMIGGSLVLLSHKLLKGVSAAMVWIVAVAILEAVIADVLDEIGLKFISDLVYVNDRGLSLGGAAAVAAIAGFVSTRYEGGLQRYREKFQVADGPERRRSTLKAGIIVLVLVIVLPALAGSLVNELLANVGLFLLMGLGLNIVVGYAGLLDLGYVAFFAVGAYTTAVLTSPLSPSFTPALTLDFLSWEGWVVFGAVLFTAAIAGILVGTPVIRMRGDYLAIVTLGFGEIVRILFKSDWLAPAFGGAQGIRQTPPAELGAIGVEITGINPQSIFYFVVVFVGVATYVSWRLSKSRVGRAWAAIREDESVAEAMGINTVKAKLLAFVVGALFASFAGMIFAVKVGSVFPNSFALLVSIIVLVLVIVGGMGSIPGVMVGALVLIGILGGPTQPGVLQEFQEFKLLIYGALLVYMMLQRPEGLLPSARRTRELHQEEYLQDAWLSSAIDAEDDAVVEEGSE